ncbi:MAG: peptidase inhibitor I78 [Sphingomonas sp.]|uniref:I78 family peptidase inhibitor n=1 Tax=Sphingomonas sp. TaxID=28214 RepID=UPI0017F22970|nr:I78 family peptidase inhibitor [Sphingomonas sp.]MBA3666132.1 peptidase inhibitor I78 [Sphingomonas sp.]
MRMFLALAVLPLTACATAEPPMTGAVSGNICKGDSLQSFVGQPAGQELGARMLAASGARMIRWVAKDMLITLEFSEQRLTVYLDGSNRVERAACG